MLIHFENRVPTCFDKVAGGGASWSFVTSFFHYFPCIILVLCLIYYFEAYSKLMKYLQLDEYTYYNFYDPDQLEAGGLALIIEKDRRKRKKTFAPARVVSPLIDY